MNHAFWWHSRARGRPDERYPAFDQRELSSARSRLSSESREQLHHNVRIAILLAEVIYGNDVGMIQDAGTSLKLKALAQLIGRFVSVLIATSRPMELSMPR